MSHWDRSDGDTRIVHSHKHRASILQPWGPRMRSSSLEELVDVVSGLNVVALRSLPSRPAVGATFPATMTKEVATDRVGGTVALS
jgi:hypothetical protein